MSDTPPDWGDVPPGEYGGQGGGGGKGGKRPAAPLLTPEQIAIASEDFFGWLANKETAEQLRMLLPDHVDPDVFIATCKTAVIVKPQLLRESLRQSLLVSVMKAAAQGLKPDGKEGALVPRYDSEAKTQLVAWQPMVWGIAKLGRETGAIKSIRAVIVFHGEPFKIVQGEEDRIEHEVDPDIVEEAYTALNGGKDTHGNPVAKPAEFFMRVRAAYCFITGSDGTVTKRWMTRQRLISLWEASKAAYGPWNSRWIDEMILKGVILFTAKWINLDTGTVTAKRFQAALMTDLEVDFDRHGALNAPPERAPQAALAAPADKLSTMEAAILATKEREKVAVETAKPGSGSSTTFGTGSGSGSSGNGATTNGAAKAAPVTNGAAAPKQDDTHQKVAEEDNVPLITRACAALEREKSGHKWMVALTSAAKMVETATDLGTLTNHPTVVQNKKDAPAAFRGQISTLLIAAAERLATPWDASKEQAA